MNDCDAQKCKSGKVMAIWKLSKVSERQIRRLSKIFTFSDTTLNSVVKDTHNFYRIKRGRDFSPPPPDNF